MRIRRKVIVLAKKFDKHFDREMQLVAEMQALSDVTPAEHQYIIGKMLSHPHAVKSMPMISDLLGVDVEARIKAKSSSHNKGE